MARNPTGDHPYTQDYYRRNPTAAPDEPIVPQQSYTMPGQPGANTGISGGRVSLPPSQPQAPQGFDYSTPEGIRSYFQSRGVTPRATSPDYWAGKWQEFGQRDPEYFKRFLSNAEEFTGGSAQTARAMGWQPQAQGGMAGGGMGNLSFLLQLLGSRLPQAQAAPGFAGAGASAAAPQMPNTQGVDIQQIVQRALGRAF